MLMVVAVNGDALLFASDAFRSDRAFILAAVGERGSALQHGLGDLRGDPDFLLECISVSPEAVLQVPTGARNDPDFMLEAVKRGAPLKYAGAALQADVKLQAAEAARASWGVKREELLITMQSASESCDLKVLSKALNEAEDLLLPDTDLQAPREMVVRLDKYNELPSLWKLLQGVPGSPSIVPPVVLIKGSWLVSLSQEGGRLPRRQDLPQGAAWELDELKLEMQEYGKSHRHRRPPLLICISHCWLTPTDPDPHGVQLGTLAWLIQHRVKDLGADVDLAIFIDYCSLFQHGANGEPRNPEQQDLFEQSLNSVDLWYAHSKTEKWLLTRLPLPLGETQSSGAAAAPVLQQISWPHLTNPVSNFSVKSIPGVPYVSRGWTCFERSLAEFLAGEPSRSCVLDIGAIDWPRDSDALLLAAMTEADDSLDWLEIRRRCCLPKEPPKLPQQFIRDLDDKCWGNASDAALIQQRYAEVFDVLIASEEQLSYRNLAWGNKEAFQLGMVLKMCTNLRSLDLDRNQICDEGVGEIMGALMECSTLERLVLSTNRIGDVGAQYIASAVPKCASLGMVDLSFNVIGNAGIEALTPLFETLDPHPALNEMLINGNDVGSDTKRLFRTIVQAQYGTKFKLYV